MGVACTLWHLAAVAGAVIAAPTAQFHVLSYNDVYELQPEADPTQPGVLLGGPSRVVPIAKKLRQTYENSLVIFAGDTMSPSLWSGQFKGLQMVAAHNALGVDFACLGNHEFDFGIDAFLNVSAASKFPWLNANAFEKSTKQLLRGTTPYAVKTLESPTMGRVKIGAFGVMYDMQDPSTGMYWTDPIAASKAQVKHLREIEKVDMVIALTHQFLDDDNIFSHEVKGVDLIFGGHDHAAMLQSQFGTPYLKSDLNFRSVWLSDVSFFAPNGSSPGFTKASHRNVQITDALPSDSAFDAVVTSYEKQVGALFQKPVGVLCGDVDFRTTALRFGEAAIGGFFADAFRAYYAGKTPVDVGIMNGGGIRTNKVWPAGTAITLGDVLSWSPFGTTIVVVETTAASFKKFLNFRMHSSCGADSAVENGHYIHTAGMHYTYTCQAKDVGTVSRLAWAATNESVPDTAVFKIAMSTYLKEKFDQSGGTGRIIVDANEGARVEVVLEKWIAGLPRREMCPVLEGRSTIVPPKA
ncbi:calcineurin-like phosphoesterase [Achlya hypogyna]|uniref:Calcineurin-like phosphoesterase n=1 Tax=Achlya hypogyna TaxID=1202772 RepID=A0A0A7CN80_ACHHY|nr:secreted protein [Achlya hypogyna]OQS00565.1 calcineurin-like phosphoesterase [Achlya hypogyna]